MFRVSVSGTEYEVRFSHLEKGTICDVFTVGANKQRRILLSRSSRIHPKDRPIKREGRKHSLAHALLGDEKNGIPPAFPKDIREKFWEAYFEKSPKSKRG